MNPNYSLMSIVNFSRAVDFDVKQLIIKFNLSLCNDLSARFSPIVGELFMRLDDVQLFSERSLVKNYVTLSLDVFS